MVLRISAGALSAPDCSSNSFSTLGSGLALAFGAGEALDPNLSSGLLELNRTSLARWVMSTSSGRGAPGCGGRNPNSGGIDKVDGNAVSEFLNGGNWKPLKELVEVERGKASSQTGRSSPRLFRPAAKLTIAKRDRLRFPEYCRLQSCVSRKL